jgi:hypothetical protein
VPLIVDHFFVENIPKAVETVSAIPSSPSSISSSSSAPSSSSSGLSQSKADGASSHQTPTGAIAGGVVGGVIILLLIVIVLLLAWRRKRRTTESLEDSPRYFMRQPEMTITTPTPYLTRSSVVDDSPLSPPSTSRYSSYPSNSSSDSKRHPPMDSERGDSTTTQAGNSPSEAEQEPMRHVDSGYRARNTVMSLPPLYTED